MTTVAGADSSAVVTPAAAVRFVIVAARRTGSNLLCTLLDSHPDVLCHHELFNPGGIYYAVPLRDTGFSLGTLQERDADPVGFIARVWSHPRGKRCVGFKMTRGQDRQVFDAVLADPGVRVIVLRRANRLKTYVSELRAELTRRWEAYDAADLDASAPKVRVEPGALDAYVAQNEAFYANVDTTLARSGSAALRVTYEDLFEAETQRRILAFLGLTAMAGKLSPRAVKQNSTDLRDLVENYDGLARIFAGSRYSVELADRGI